MATLVMGPARSRSYFENPATLKTHLADQLAKGRLAVVIGSGASVGFGLYTWDELLESCLARAGIKRVTGHDAAQTAEHLFVNGCGRDDVEFARLVAAALYENAADLSFEALRKSGLLSAIGALSMFTLRRSFTRIISYNFDDLLERYLQKAGLRVSTVTDLPCWAGSGDITVYHPHGLLPSGTPPEKVDRPIVFAAIHFDRLRAHKQLWLNLILDILSSHTCLFIGLSGNDEAFRHSLYTANEVHVSRAAYAFWGVRFSDDPADKNLQLFEERGVYQHTLAYPDLPAFLFELCELAAR
jgi:hypothetical protein